MRIGMAPVLLGALALPSCGSDATAPTMADVAGDYSATSFVGAGFDVLAEGGSLDMTLGADGSVAGGMIIPASAGGPFQADMAGTYTLSGNNLTFQQAADTFVRDATWTWSRAPWTGHGVARAKLWWCGWSGDGWCGPGGCLVTPDCCCITEAGTTGPGRGHRSGAPRRS